MMKNPLQLILGVINFLEKLVKLRSGHAEKSCESVAVIETNWKNVSRVETSETNVNLSYIVEDFEWLMNDSQCVYLFMYDRSGKFLSNSSNSAGKKD